MPKHNKYTPEWEKEVKRQSLILDKGETDDTKKKSQQLQKLLEQRTDLAKEQQDKTTEVRKLETERKQLLNLASYLREVNNEITRLNTNQTTQESRMANFLGTTYENTTTAPTTNLWKGTFGGANGNGWIKSTQDHFTPTTGQLDNIYKIKVNNTQVVDITEEQAVNTIAYVVHGLKQVDLSDFTAKYNAKESDTVKKNKVKNYLTNIQNQEIIVGSDKDANGNAKQPSYDFAHTYQKYNKSTNTWTAYTAPAFNYTEFFEFIELTNNQPFLKDLDADKQKDVPQIGSWQIFKKGEAYKAQELKDYGIEIDPTKTTLYKTGSDKETIITSQKGVDGWLELAHSLTYLADNQTKITAAFSSSPTQKLIDDLKTWNVTNGYITDGTNWTLPESITSIEEIKDQIEMEKMGAAVKLVDLKKQIEDKKAENTKTKGEITAKEQEIDTLVKEIITKKREILNNYEINKGFKDDNRRSSTDLWKIKNLLSEIRYCENDGNTQQDSSISEENTAFTEITNIFADTQKWHLIQDFENLAFAEGSDSKGDIQQAITRIKSGKYTDSDGKEQQVYSKLEEYHQHFTELAKLVKLHDWQEKAANGIKTALGKKEDPTDTLQTYQQKLKALDPLLDETIITQSVIDDWKTQNNFKTSQTMEAEIKKVIKDNKLDEEFAKLIKKEDAEITDIANLFKKKKAKDIITLIRRWEYDKNTDADKRKKLVWTLEKKDSNGKYLEDAELTDEEINSVLYDIAVGNKTLASAKKEDKTNDNQTPTDTKDKWYQKFGYLACWGIPLAVILLGVALFRDKVKGWWDGPAEEKIETTEEEESDDKE